MRDQTFRDGSERTVRRAAAPVLSMLLIGVSVLLGAPAPAMAAGALHPVDPPRSGDIPVIDAARAGDIETVRNLLRSGADVNAAEGDGMTALHWAADQNHAETARILAFAGAKLNARTRIGAFTPLLVASRLGNAEVMEVLLEAGADLTVRTSTGGSTPLHLAASAGNARAVELLLDHGAEIDAREEAWGHTPLMVAAVSGRRDAARVLIARGADPTLANHAVDMVEREREDQRLRQLRNQRVAFMRDLGRDRAAVADLPAEPEEAEEVVAEEAKLPAEGEETSEEEAEPGVEQAEAPATEADGAEPDARAPDATAEEPSEREEEATPLSYAGLVGGYGGFTALHLAARHGDAEMVRLLLDAGAELNRVSDGDRTSPLLIAVVNGHWDLAMDLLALGADPNLASDNGATPLYGVLNLRWAPAALHPQPRAHLVQEVDYLEAMEALLAAGADPNARLEKHLWYKSYNFDLLGVDTGGASPFWRAAYATDVRAMRLLLEHGADPTVATRKPAERRRGGSGDGEDEEDPSGLPPVPVGGPSVTPLHAASGAGYGEGFAANAHRHVPGGWVPAARFLVEEVGLDVDARDHNGFTPLHHAAARGDLDLIRYLVSQGADVAAVSRSGLTTADMANGPAQRVPPFPRAIALLRELGSDFSDYCRSC